MDLYVGSVVMYFIGIWIVAGIYGERITENGWPSDDVEVDLVDGLAILLDTLLIACIPVVRFLYVAWLLVMATFTKESVENWADKFINRF